MNKAEIIKTQNTLLIVSFFTIVGLSLAILVSFSLLSGYRYTKFCRSFSSQKDAQSALHDFPLLDGNKDGIACNQLK